MGRVKTIVASHNPDLSRDFDRELLRRRDLRLVTARTIGELLERLRQGAELCFLDRVLPDGNADAALEAIRADRRLSALPVILMTSQGAPLDRARIRSQGFTDTIELPARPGALSLLVACHLGSPLRAEERFSVRLQVFDESGLPGESHLGTTVDLSQAGLLLLAKRELALGARLALRFHLLGHADELHVAARVVRIDDRSFAPQHAVALAFEGLSTEAQDALRRHLELIVGARPFSWLIEESAGRTIVTLLGVLRAESDLTPLDVLTGEVLFRMRDFRRISSDSVQRWIELVRSLTNVTRISLVECPVAFIHQANLITNLLERQEVMSFFAPYTCESCGLDEEQLIDVAAHLEGGHLRQPPPFLCSACSNPLVFDDLVDHFFSFLERP